ncbi:MAG TPA: hypothetical protein VGT41_01440 [Candidatus Babeliales bacterium]|nr:hypothetical protein [Candidatus Babeliales bacterium]
MDKIIITYENSGVTVDEIAAVGKRLQPEIERVNQACATGYESDYASINLPADAGALRAIHEVLTAKKKLRPTLLLLIGMGGSSLGTIALLSTLKGSFFNETSPDTQFYCADTVDPDYIEQLVFLVERTLRNHARVLIVVASKSGTTVETTVNFEIFLSLLKKYKPDTYADCVVVITDHGSALWQLASAQQFTALAVPKQVGGRYSVFSPIGLFPLGMLGVDIDELLAGAKMAVDVCTGMDIQTNSAALTAAILFLQYKQGYTIHDLFLFGTDLKDLGRWYQQLVAESVAKEYDRTGNRVEAGITPTVSIGTTDLHSLAQLHLGGRRDTFSSFVFVKEGAELPIPRLQEFSSMPEAVHDISVADLFHAIGDGVMQAYIASKRPFIKIEINKKNSWDLGYFMQYKMIEIMYLGFLMDVNPFDQPNVELYKQKTREILSHESK